MDGLLVGLGRTRRKERAVEGCLMLSVVQCGFLILRPIMKVKLRRKQVNPDSESVDRLLLMRLQSTRPKSPLKFLSFFREG